MTTSDAATEQRFDDIPLYTMYALERAQPGATEGGVRRVAYAFEFPTGVLLVWDDDWATLDVRPDMDTVRTIHNQNHATELVQLADDDADGERALTLLRRVYAASALIMDTARPVVAL
jgi:hypothetical protein